MRAQRDRWGCEEQIVPDKSWATVTQEGCTCAYELVRRSNDAGHCDWYVDIHIVDATGHKITMSFRHDEVPDARIREELMANKKRPQALVG